MYGIILQSIVDAHLGDARWTQVKDRADVDDENFDAFETVRDEELVGRLTRCAVELSRPGDDVTVDYLMRMCGERFVAYVCCRHADYGRILPVLGRRMRDFLNGLDKLHEYVRPRFPLMSPPSFFCDAETSDGMTLHYRSRRRGFEYYVAGQIREVRGRVGGATLPARLETSDR